MKKCEFCNIEITSKFGSGRFCSIGCSKKYSSNINKEIKNSKISDSLEVFNLDKEKLINCAFCGIEFSLKNRSKKLKTCSLSCSAKLRNKNPDYIKKISGPSSNKKGKIRKPISEETRKKMSKAKIGNDYSKGKKYKSIKKNINLQSEKSLNNKGGRCKWIDFIKKDGVRVKLQGTYEFRFANILEKIEIDWIKPSIWDKDKQFRWIDSKGDFHYYTPDFWSETLNMYYETKGYWGEKNMEKKKFVESIPNLLIIYKEDLLFLEKEIRSNNIDNIRKKLINKPL